MSEWAPALGIPAPVVSPCCNARKFDRTRPKPAPPKLYVAGEYLVNGNAALNKWIIPRECIRAKRYQQLREPEPGWWNIPEIFCFPANYINDKLTWAQLFSAQITPCQEGQGLAPGHLSPEECSEGGAGDVLIVNITSRIVIAQLLKQPLLPKWL